MERRAFVHRLLAASAVPFALPAAFAACARPPAEAAAGVAAGDPTPASLAGTPTVARLDKPPAEWERTLTPEAYGVLFEDGTERPFSSALNREKRTGTYVCAACALPLFASAAKFESGTGWPSFTRPIVGHLGLEEDRTLGMARTEYHCARCGGHQGHVFPDGPRPTNHRWCNNGVALAFVPEGTPLPALRT